ncbi:MAG: hypothetical protein ABR508_00870 [Candidatus Baltobacteraceae bacterium]
MKIRFVAGLGAVLFALAGSALALAGTPTPPPQATTAPAVPNPLPSVPAGIEQDAINALGNIVKSAFGWSDTESYGTVVFYKGTEMQVRQQLNRFREIHLHRGTVINPRGWSIQSGQIVDVRGRPNADGSLNADMIVVQNAH